MSRVTAVLTLGVALLVFAGPAAAFDSFFDIFTDNPVVGPAPLPPLDQGVGHMTAGMFQLDLEWHTQLRQMTGGGQSLPAEVELSNGLPPGPSPAVDSFFDVFYRIDLADGKPYPADSFFDVFVELDMPGVGPSHLVPLDPDVPNVYFDVFIKDGFYITYQVEVGPGGGCHELTMHFECAEGFEPGNIQIVPSPNFDSFFDVFFELHQKPGPVNDPTLVIHATTTGELLTPPVEAQTATWGKVKGLYR